MICWTRSTQRQGISALKESPAPEYDAPPLPASPADFWRTGEDSFHFPAQIEPPPVPYPALMRLGAPMFMEDIETWLGPAYDAMSKAAIASVYTDDESQSEDGAA